MFPGNVQAGKKCAILYTIWRTAAASGSTPANISRTCSRDFPAMKASEAASLTPAHWLAARNGKKVRAAA